MRQQINLFSYVPVAIKSWLDTNKLLALWGSFLLLLMLIYFIGTLQKTHETAKLSALDTKVENARKDLIAIAAKYPQTGVSSQVLNAGRQPSCNTKFSTYLEGFSAALVPGVWLTEITVEDNGKTIILKGSALHALAVQQYLLELKQVAVFAPLNFTIQDLNQTTPSITFIMTAKVPDAGIS